MKITRYIYGFRALDDFILLYPLYAVMFAAHGLSPLAISTLLVIWSATSIIAEVPSGVLADRYSRRNLLIIGQLLRAAGYAMWLIFPGYLGFALGFVLWGLEGALWSGTFQALVYDELKKEGEEKQYAKVMGRADSIGVAAELVATALASVAILFGYPLLILLSIVAVLAAAAVISRLPEAARVEAVEDEHYWAALRRGIRESWQTPGVRKLVLLGAFIGAVYGTFDEYIPLFFQAIGSSVPLIPIWTALAIAMTVVASLVAYRFEHWRNTTFMVVTALTGLLLAGAGYLQGVSGIILVALFMFFIKALSVIYDAKLQHNIVSDLRATITSVSGFLAEVTSIAMYLLFGLAANYLDYTGAFVIGGLGVMAVALLFLTARKRMFRVAATK